MCLGVAKGTLSQKNEFSISCLSLAYHSAGHFCKKKKGL